MPFLKLEGEGPGEPDVVLRQVGPNAFQLLHGFRYRLPDGSKTYDVPAHDPTLPPNTPNNQTDLASVPTWLWWFVASYGLHTRAALLHDQLVDVEKIDRVEADETFRLALEESKVRWMRRWLMWAAVSLATLAATKRMQFAAFAALLGLFLVFLVGWPLGLLDGLPGPAWAPALIVFAAGLVWRRLWLASVVGLVIVAAPTVLVWAALALVWLLDLAKALLGRLQGRRLEVPPLAPPKEEGRKF